MSYRWQIADRPTPEQAKAIKERWLKARAAGPPHDDDCTCRSCCRERERRWVEMLERRDKEKE